RTLSDVHAVVVDHQPMRRKAMQMADKLAASPSSEASEAAAFMHWLCDDHFTFLGFRSFDFTDGTLVQESHSALGLLRNRPVATRRALSDLRDATREFLLEPTLLSFSKAGTPSRVHRPAYPDYIGIKRFDRTGKVCGEDGFLGLYTSPVYSDQPSSIPVLRRKVAWVHEQAEYRPGSYDSKALHQILATYPRDELFQTPADALFRTATAIAHIHERRKTRLFLWRGRYGMFFNCLVYLPRDAFNTKVRTGIEKLLTTQLGATDVEFSSYFSESILVRLQYILRVDPNVDISYDLQALEQQIIALSTDWQSTLRQALGSAPGNAAAGSSIELAQAFPSDYQERFDHTTARFDIGHLLSLADAEDLRLRFYQTAEHDQDQVNLKLFRRGQQLPLSKVVPVLENLGFHVVSEHPYLLSGPAHQYSIQDLTLAGASPIDLEAIGDLFEDAFRSIWAGFAESDALNGLITAQRLQVHEVALLRSYARYMKQAAFGFEQAFIADTLLKHGSAARMLVQQFKALLKPAQTETDCTEAFDSYTAAIESLNEDRVLRLLMALISATVRSNYFAQREDHSLIVHKLAPAQLLDLPEPRPAFEVFVYAPDMEGVHLRSSKVARGGIRWSDRPEDYRTEVLGLVKAQIVKNAVIVPSGAKGGFVVKGPADRDAGVAAYQRFIRGLLSVSDNLVDGKLVMPAGIHRRDDDDPYLVVAADKGTATFSDIANAIASERGFWLGDGFASGGSAGYDHKKMGITARGAWISVQRHFRSLGIDPQIEPITVVGVGDMAGDVFGNGMLQSRSIKLLAAFNHQHIFIDPDPDPEASYHERLRLFELPRSSWSDYNQELISAGGGIFSRSQKSIALTAPMRAAFAIEADQLSGDALIHQLLKAPVDLFWNGGIGTYVKATTEPHDAAGDRANDGLRINGSDLRARVVGEGGNLGLTHAGRTEYASHGGLVNADFIDNAGGVDCSDHEVNLKILLSSAMEAGTLPPAEREPLLLAQDDAVAELVLKNNFVQARCLSLAAEHSVGRADEYNRLAHELESTLGFDREEADFPADDVLQDRARTGQGLLLPEMATLLGYAKLLLKHDLANSQFEPDPDIAAIARDEFPGPIVERFGGLIPQHRLHSALVNTLLANDIIGFAGVSFVSRLKAFVGCETQDVVRAYWVSARLFDLRQRTEWLDAADVPVDIKRDAMLDQVRLVRRLTRWLVRNHRNNLNVEQLLERYTPHIPGLLADPDTLFLSNSERANHHQQSALLPTKDCPLPAIGLGFELFGALAVAEAAARSKVTATTAGPVYRAVGELLQIDILSEHLAKLPSGSHWRAMERDALLDDLCERQLVATQKVLESSGDVVQWAASQRSFVERWRSIVSGVPLGPDQEFAGISMTVRKLVDLAAGY
ncbi:MAG: NAD-glutamate dehydrogenase, partial [Pseudomonadales bacterium]